MDFFNEEKFKYFWEGGKVLLLFLILGFNIFMYFSLVKKQELIEVADAHSMIAKVDEEDNDDKKIVKQEKILVDLKGAVVNPGVYELENGSVINDLIKLGGGVKKGVSLKNINLSKKVTDEMVVYVYTDSELKKLEREEKIEKECVCSNIDITSCEGSSVIITDKSDSSSMIFDNTLNDNSTNDSNNDSTSSDVVSKVSINTATIEELMTLSGIGESKAKAVIEYRRTNGNFKSIEEIKNVSGIGESLYQKIKDSITI